MEGVAADGRALAKRGDGVGSTVGYGGFPHGGGVLAHRLGEPTRRHGGVACVIRSHAMCYYLPSYSNLVLVSPLLSVYFILLTLANTFPTCTCYTFHNTTPTMKAITLLRHKTSIHPISHSLYGLTTYRAITK